MATSPLPMSAPNLPVVLAPRARRDFADILLYTLQHWGEEQEAAHAAALFRALALSGENPAIGRVRDDLRPVGRTFPVADHLIIFDVREETVRVARVLHGRISARRAPRESP